MRKEFVKQIDSSREAPAELVSLSHGSALIGANQSCTLCGATPAVTKARYKNPLGNIDYTHIFCDNCANKYGVGQSGTIYRAEPMEQAFLLLKDIAREIAEYQEGMLHGTSPYHSLRLSPVRHGPPTKGRKLDTLENRRFLSGFNLGGKGYELPTNEIIERMYGGKGKVRNSPLPLLDPVTGESLSGRFVFNAEALAFSPNLTQRGHIDNQGNILDMNALTRANPDVPPGIHNDKLNLYGFEGIDPHRFGENIQAEGIIYGDVDENKVHQLNDNPLSIKEISRASRLMSPFVNAKKEFDSFKEHDYKRIRRAAEALMRAQIPPVMFDTQGLDNQNIWSPDDPRLAEPVNAKFLHDPFKQWDKGAGKNTEEMHQQVAYGAMSPEQFELLDHDLVFASEPMEIAMRLLKAYLPTLQERGRKIDDQVSLRWIPRYHESTFNAPVPFHSSRGNVNWEQRLQNEKLKAPKDSAHSQRKTLPGVFEGDSKTPSNKPITGSWVAPATQQGAMGADVSFNDKGLLMAISENPDWWRTVQQGAAQESPGGEGFKYGGFDKEAFSKIPTPNISPISMLHYQMALESPMLQEDEVAQHFPDEHELITQFPNIKTEDIWGPSADLTINPVKVASEPMDLAMRLLKEFYIGDNEEGIKGLYAPADISNEALLSLPRNRIMNRMRDTDKNTVQQVQNEGDYSSGGSQPRLQSNGDFVGADVRGINNSDESIEELGNILGHEYTHSLINPEINEWAEQQHGPLQPQVKPEYPTDMQGASFLQRLRTKPINQAEMDAEKQRVELANQARVYAHEYGAHQSDESNQAGVNEMLQQRPDTYEYWNYLQSQQPQMIQASEPMDIAMRLLKRQTNLGEHHEDFPSPYGPVVAYHGTTGDDARKIMGGDGLKTHSDNYRTMSTNPSESLSYAIDRSVGHHGGGTHSEPKLLAIRQAAFDNNHPNYIGPSHNFKTAQRQTVDFSDATHYGGNIPRQFLTNTPITNQTLENTAQARTNQQNDINTAMSRPALSLRGQIAQRENTEIDTPELQQTNQRGEVRPQEPRISRFAAKWGRGGQTGEQRMADYNQQMTQYMQPNPVVQPTDPNQQQLPLQQPQVQQPQVQQPQMIQAGEPMDLAMRLLKNEPADYADTYQQVRNNIATNGEYMTDEELNAIDEYYSELHDDESHLEEYYNLLEAIELEKKRRAEGSFDGIGHNEETGFTRSEPMEIAMQLLKERVSPEAKRHKLEYDKKYESSPERVKYREELNRERRRRHIMGQGGPDMSHTSQHTIVPEDPHTNRARHFKDKGTLL